MQIYIQKVFKYSESEIFKYLNKYLSQPHSSKFGVRVNNAIK